MTTTAEAVKKQNYCSALPTLTVLQLLQSLKTMAM